MKKWSPFLLAAWVMLSLGACKRGESAHQHAEEHPAGHDHHQEDHGHGDSRVVRITRWSDSVELFAEHPAVTRGEAFELIAHVTVLKTFRPLAEGELRVELEGPAQLQATGRLEKPGIFKVSLTLPTAGVYRARFVISGPLASTVEGAELQAYENADAAAKAVPSGHEGRFIELLKEQQWGIPFATEFAKQAVLAPSIEVAGSIDTPPGGTAEVGAPISGLLVAPSGGFPRPGQTVRKGQILASLAPAPSSPEESTRADLSVSEAEARAAKARAALARAERLIQDEAISQRELEDARREKSVAEEAVRAARSAKQMFSGGNSGSWKLTAPIDGTVADVRANPGAPVSPGTILFRIVDTRELWLRARVPEQDAARLRMDRDAQYQVAGLDTWNRIDVTGTEANASVVTLGRTVDPASRTVEVIYALNSADPNLRIGGLIRMSLPAGEEFSGLAVPRSAVIDNDGREVVYVQVDGEHFAERAIRTGVRQGELLAVTEGLKPGERIVTVGANVVRLASKSNDETPHGHVH